MRVTKKQITKPNKERVRYSITELTAAEFASICNALGLVKEADQTAAALYKTFNDLASAPDSADVAAATEELTTDLERLKRILDD